MPILESDHLDEPEIDSEFTDETSGELPGWLSTNIDKSRKRFGRKDKEPRRIGRRKNLTEPLADGIVFVGTMTTFVRPITGTAIVDQADDVAKALNDLAKTNDRLYRMLERLTTSGSYGKLFAATMPILAAGYVETFPTNTGLLSTQAVMVMENGLSDEAMSKIIGFMEKKEAKKSGGKLTPVA